jgi:hypothetical protein
MVVQVITVNGANYKATGRILMERFPSLFWSSWLDLKLEDMQGVSQLSIIGMAEFLV